MIWIGLDVHKSFTTAGSFDPASGEVGHLGEVATRPQELTEVVARIPGAKTVVLEAGCKSHWVAATLESWAQQAGHPVARTGGALGLQLGVNATSSIGAAAVGVHHLDLSAQRARHSSRSVTPPAPGRGW